jgi:hypothetical protein
LQVGSACLAVLLLLRVVAVSIDAFAGTSNEELPAGGEWILASILMGLTPSALQFGAALAARWSQAQRSWPLSGVTRTLLWLSVGATVVIASGSLAQQWDDSMDGYELTRRTDALFQIGLALASIGVLTKGWSRTEALTDQRTSELPG